MLISLKSIAHGYCRAIVQCQVESLPVFEHINLFPSVFTRVRESRQASPHSGKRSRRVKFDIFICGPERIFSGKHLWCRTVDYQYFTLFLFVPKKLRRTYRSIGKMLEKDAKKTRGKVFYRFYYSLVPRYFTFKNIPKVSRVFSSIWCHGNQCSSLQGVHIQPFQRVRRTPLSPSSRGPRSQTSSSCQSMVRF